MNMFGSSNKYGVTTSSKFRRNLRRSIKRGYDLEKLISIVHKLANDIPLDPNCNDHQLKGNKKQFRECHIAPDWLLVYEKKENTLILYLYATGTHADILE